MRCLETAKRYLETDMPTGGDRARLEKGDPSPKLPEELLG